jgi:hypothetical protein
MTFSFKDYVCVGTLGLLLIDYHGVHDSMNRNGVIWYVLKFLRSSHIPIWLYMEA